MRMSQYMLCRPYYAYPNEGLSSVFIADSSLLSVKWEAGRFRDLGFPRIAMNRI